MEHSEGSGQSVRVLSIQQPFADFVFHLGKWCENRSWRTNYRGTMYIHASKLDAAEVKAWKETGVDLREHLDLTTGAIIGKVELMDCIPSADLHRFAPKKFRKEWLFGKVDRRAAVPESLQELQQLLKTVDDQTWQFWTHDEFCWIFVNAELLAEPVPAKGKLNIWEHVWDPRFAETAEPTEAGA